MDRETDRICDWIMGMETNLSRPLTIDEMRAAVSEMRFANNPRSAFDAFLASRGIYFKEEQKKEQSKKQAEQDRLFALYP